MRVVVLPADDTGCGVYRMVWPAQAVKEIRPDWRIDIYHPSEVQFSMNQETGKLAALRGIEDPHSVDVLVMQRVGIPGSVALLKWFQSNGTALVIDADDALWCIDRDNTAFSAWNSPNGLHWRWLDEAMSIADLSTVTTKRLADRYGRHGRFELLPNRVPGVVVDIASARDDYFPSTPALGWAGFLGTHPKDPQTIAGAIQTVVERTGCDVRVVGDGPGTEKAWGLPEGKVHDLGSQKLGVDYYRAMSSVDVGVVPLADSTFNKAKSSLKALEYSAMGVPCVAAPTPANIELAREIPGVVIARTHQEWVDHLVFFLTHRDEAQELGERSRKAVAANWTMEGNAENWAKAWERAYNRRKSMDR